jgi:hypothetical protein
MKQDINQLCGDQNNFERVMIFLAEKSDLSKPNDEDTDVRKSLLYKKNINTKFDVNKLIKKCEIVACKQKVGKPLF